MSNYSITVDTGGASSVAGLDLAAFFRNTGIVHSALEGILSLLTSVAGLPEVPED